MRPAHVLVLFAALIATMLLLGPCQAIQQSDHSLSLDAPSETHGSQLSEQVNAFGLGFFAGLTVGISDFVLGEMMSAGTVERARSHRRAHEAWDTLGKLCGFAMLAYFGWLLYRRLRP